MPRQLRHRKTTEDTIEGRYRRAVLSYLYLQSKRRSIAISELPPDMLEHYGCTPMYIGKRTVTFDVKVPEGVGRSEVKERISKIWETCSRSRHRHLFYREVQVKYTISDFFKRFGLLVDKGGGTNVKEGWYKDRELALEAVRFLYGKVLRKDLDKEKPQRREFTLRGLKGLLDDVFKGDPEEAVRQAGLIPENPKQKETEVG